MEQKLNLLFLLLKCSSGSDQATCQFAEEEVKVQNLIFSIFCDRKAARHTYVHPRTHTYDTWHIDDQSLRMEGDNRNRIPSNTRAQGTHTLRTLSERDFAIYSWAKTLSILFSLLLSCFGKPLIFYGFIQFYYDFNSRGNSKMKIVPKKKKNEKLKRTNILENNFSWFLIVLVVYWLLLVSLCVFLTAESNCNIRTGRFSSQTGENAGRDT